MGIYPIVGEKVGKYDLLSVLGEGTTACVYKSFHKYFKVDVVIKLLSPVLVKKSPIIKELFLEEALHLSKLNHSGIIKVIDADDSDFTYIVLEFVEGKPLDVLIKDKGSLSPINSIKTVINVCKALDYMAGFKMVHRDIKPGNIMVTDDFNIKILDFGISKVINEPVKFPLIGGPMCGTLYYMSPEQLTDSERVDQRADMYSVGATMYHMLTGKKPFETDNVSEIISMHINQIPVPPRNISDKITPELSAFVMRLLEKSPSSRYQKYVDLIYDLESIIKKYEVFASYNKSEEIIAQELEKVKDNFSNQNIKHDESDLKNIFFKHLSNEHDKHENEKQSNSNLPDSQIKQSIQQPYIQPQIKQNRPEDKQVLKENNEAINNDLAMKFLKNFTSTENEQDKYELEKNTNKPEDRHPIKENPEVNNDLAMKFLKNLTNPEVSSRDLSQILKKQFDIDSK